MLVNINKTEEMNTRQNEGVVLMSNNIQSDQCFRSACLLMCVHMGGQKIGNTIHYNAHQYNVTYN